MSILHCGRFRLSLERPLLMGIVNLTPDSFSGDGMSSDVARAICHARQQLDAGADILDVGAESSRPGAIPTPEAEELRRLIPVLREVASWNVPVSVDTYKPVVMRAALEAGATMINDISALTHRGAIDVIAGSDCAVCLMHMAGEPGTMQRDPLYDDVVGEVRAFLGARVAACRSAGVAENRIVLDPGFGFGKTLEHNLALFRALTATGTEDLPILVGVSRKSMLGTITGRPVEARMAASIAAALLAVQKGAKILRVHDVAETKDALAVLAALEEGVNLQ
ncbi:MAG TPA: dihydropteroate synthase [Rhodocyclaceae bacterium]|nr:dihydropteroate synthase [Rhodocyclaceae bacterium]